MIKSEGRLLYGDVTSLLWQRRALGESSMLCTVFNNSFVVMESWWRNCSLWKESKIKWLIYEPALLCSAICQAYTLDSAVCPVLSPTHPHAAYLIVTGLYPETQSWLTMVDWQLCRATFSSSWWHCAPFLRDSLHPPRQQALAHRGFILSAWKCLKCFAFDLSPCKPQQTTLVKWLCSLWNHKCFCS